MLNNFVKGIIFNMGILIVSGFVYLAKRLIKRKQSDYFSPICNIMPWPFTVSNGGEIYDAPSMSTSILSFSSSYIIYPMIINNQVNYSLLVFLIVITCINAVVVYSQKCSGLIGIVVGLVLGILTAIGYYHAIALSEDKDKLVYFTDTISNNVKCGRPNTDQNFVCEVFKDGRSYSTTTTTTP